MKRIVVAVLLAGVGAFALAGCQQNATVHGPGGKVLRMFTPRSASVERGRTAVVKIGLRRKNFDDAITVILVNLPTGVTARGSSVTTETNEATFILDAAEDAPRVANYAVNVRTTGPDGMVALEQFLLTVKDKPGLY